MIRIVLADDHASVRKGFLLLIEREADMTIVAECAGLADTEAALAAMAADVLVLDITMRSDSGLAGLPRLRALHPELRIVVMSMHEGDAYVSEALARGADGYVTKAVAPEELIAAVRAVMAGQRGLRSSDIAARSRAAPAVSLSSLSAREREVFMALAGGDRPKQVAASLGVSVKTVYVQRASVLAKLGVRSDRDLYRIALENGWLDAGGAG